MKSVVSPKIWKSQISHLRSTAFQKKPRRRRRGARWCLWRAVENDPGLIRNQSKSCNNVYIYIITFFFKYIYIYIHTYHMLCYLMLCYVILCYVMLCYVMLYYVILYYIISYYIMLYYIILYYII